LVAWTSTRDHGMSCGRNIPHALLLVVLILCRACWPVSADCSPASVSVTVGGINAQKAIPALAEGEVYISECASVRAGYVGTITITCLSLVHSVNTVLCKPEGCREGQGSPARIGDSPELLYVSLRRGLEHQGADFLPCRDFKPGYFGYINVRCSFGAMSADAANCHPELGSPSTVFRILNGQYLAGSWRIFELDFYSEPDCVGGKLKGEYFASSEDAQNSQTVALAMDGNRSTFWSSWCPGGCDTNTAWMGIVLQTPGTVRCLNILQSQVTCCRSDRIRLEVWDGEGWQELQVWEFEGSSSVLGKNLVVPITCNQGKPSGPGVIHDCDGPPVVGLQDTQTCTAKCGEGYAGDGTTFTCGGDGLFSGTAPTCWNTTEISNMASFSIIGIVLAVLAFQYSCMYMQGKARLTWDLDQIPGPMVGRWMEQKGERTWMLLMADKKARDHAKLIEMGQAAGFDKIEDELQQIQDRSPGGSPMGSPKGASSAAVEGLIFGAKTKRKEKYVGVDGLCSPCEDPNICWAYAMCPCCRIADSWHTVGVPEWQTYWKVFTAYILCPCLWPCLNFYGRYRIRKAFRLNLEPHRDFIAHCICCCCCSPCAHMQEARLVDGPVLYFKCKNKLIDIQNRQIRRVGELL